MSLFFTRLVLEADETDDGMWTVMERLAYYSSIADMTIVVPSGFRTDLASVPRIPLIYDATGGIANAAAVIHDYLYDTGLLPRALADKVFLEAAQLTGVSALQRYMMYAGIFIFGARRYKQR